MLNPVQGTCLMLWVVVIMTHMEAAVVVEVVLGVAPVLDAHVVVLRGVHLVVVVVVSVDPALVVGVDLITPGQLVLVGSATWVLAVQVVLAIRALGALVGLRT
jgi:hypothetical protein